MFKIVKCYHTYLINDLINYKIHNQDINNIHEEQYKLGYEFVSLETTSCITEHGFMEVKLIITYKKCVVKCRLGMTSLMK